MSSKIGGISAMAPNARKKRKNPQNLRPATGEEEEQPQQSGSSTKKVRITKNQQSHFEVLAGEEEQKQQQQNDGVSMKKAESLSSPILFPPPPQLRLRQLPAIAAQESLLKRLGLWEFVNLDLGEDIREDLMNELVLNYSYYPQKFTGESRVKGVGIRLNRTAVANALHLPVERVAKGASFPVSKDESAFLEKLIWGHLVLRDASVVFDSFILGFFEGLKELRLVNADWAGLVWFMVERELLSGERKKLVKCYYASHLQLVLKHQRPELFDDHHGNEVVIEGGNLDGVCEVDSLEHAAKLLLDLQSHYRPEFDFKNVAEKKRGSLAEFSGEEMDIKADETGKEVKPATSVDLMTREAHAENDIYSEKYEVAGKRETEQAPQAQKQVDKYEDECQPEGFMLQVCTAAEVAGKSGTDHAPQPQQEVVKYEYKCQPEGFMLQDCTTADHSIVFQPPPPQLLDITAHESLLTRLGLWEFVNLELDETIREDLLKELMVSYDFNTRESLVNGLSISLDRTAAVNALRLPAERFVKDGSFPVSEEEGLFLKELFWGYLILRDGGGDASMMSLMSQTYVLGFAEILKEMRFEEADWAGLVWFMIELELLKGQRKNLVRCYYASHLQLLLKHQRPELFDDEDEDEVVGLTDEDENEVVGSTDEDEDEVVGSTDEDEDEVVGSTDEDSGSVSVGDEDDDHCADLAGREFGGDDQVTEVGNLGVSGEHCTVTSLEKGAKHLLDLQIGLNSEIHYTENEDDLMQNEAKEAACDNASKMHCMKEDSMVLDGDYEGVRNTITDNAFKVQCLKEDYVVQYEGSEARAGKSADLHFEKKDDAMEDQETEAAFEANLGNSLDVHCVKDGKENESDSLTIEQDNHKPELKLEYVAGREFRGDDQVTEVGNLGVSGEHCPVTSLEKGAKHLLDLQIGLNSEIHYTENEDDLMQNEAKEAACDNASKMHCMKEDSMVLDGDYEGVHNTSTDNAFKVQCFKEDYVVQYEGSEARAAKSADLHFEKKDDAMEDQETEAAFEANLGNSLDVHCVKDGKENESDSLTIAQDNHKPELKLEYVAEDNRGNGMECQSELELINASEINGDCLEISEKEEEDEDEYCIQHKKVNTTDELIDIEMYHNGGTELGLTQSGKEDDAQKLDKVRNDTYSEKYEMVCRRFAPSEGLLHQCGSMINGESEDSMDLDLCAEQIKLWTAKFTNLAKRKVEEENHNSREFKLQKQIEEKDKIIQQYELKLQMEQQQKEQFEQMKQMDRQQRHKYERHLYLMGKVVEDYRKAAKETNASFAKYRERVQLPEEPLYMPHPDGGGDVILVSEGKKLEEERQKKVIKEAVDDFEAVWSAYFEEEIGALNLYSDKLAHLEDEVKRKRGRL